MDKKYVIFFFCIIILGLYITIFLEVKRGVDLSLSTFELVDVKLENLSIDPFSAVFVLNNSMKNSYSYEFTLFLDMDLYLEDNYITDVKIENRRIKPEEEIFFIIPIDINSSILNYIDIYNDYNPDWKASGNIVVRTMFNGFPIIVKRQFKNSTIYLSR